MQGPRGHGPGSTQPRTLALPRDRRVTSHKTVVPQFPGLSGVGGLPGGGWEDEMN